MSRIDYIIELAKKNPKKIVLPETDDERVVEAAKEIKREGIANLLSIESADKEKMAQGLYGLQRHRGMTVESARKAIDDPLYAAAMMVHLGMADSFVAGASRPTRDVIRAAIQCLGISRSIGMVFGLFLIEVKNCQYGEGGFFIFADCAVIPVPSAKQLARIALSSGEFMKSFFHIEPRIALLTYSSYGSAEGESIDRAREAVAKIREDKPDLLVDGELQFDAAVIPEIQRRKAPESPLKGRANILIFPSLDAGNITYKAVERLGNARAVGPALMGLNKPSSDLSRGCSVKDIVATVALTSVRVGK